MSDVKIRLAEKGDAFFIVQFNQAMALETEGNQLDPETIQQGVENVLVNFNHGFYLIAEIKDSVVGCLMITYEWSDWRNGQFWWIQSVYVKPEFRQMGVFRSLYEHVRKMAVDSGLSCGLRLYVEKDNIKAQNTYQSLGMDQTNYLFFEEEFNFEF